MADTSQHISVADLTEEERERFALLLLAYIPELRDPDVPIAGSEAVDAIGWLYNNLGGEVDDE